jgi:hypothetical protein
LSAEIATNAVLVEQLVGIKLQGAIEMEERIAALVYQHDKDLYRGNGLPGLTTRMKSAEDKMSTIENEIVDLKDYNTNRENKLDTKMNIIIGSMISGLIAVVVDMVLKHK